jgi:AcrR family transcriptional regulator
MNMQSEMGNRLQRRRQRTRKLLQQAAIELILEKGYDAVTIQDITDHADLGRGTFYLYFTDKEDIVWQTVRGILDEFDRELNQRYPQRTPLTEFISYQVLFEQVDKNRDFYRIMLGSKGSTALTERIQTYFITGAESEIREHSMFAELGLPPTIAAQCVTGALTRLIFWWIETPNEYTPKQMAGMFFHLVYRKLPPGNA